MAEGVGPAGGDGQQALAEGAAKGKTENPHGPCGPLEFQLQVERFALFGPLQSLKWTVVGSLKGNSNRKQDMLVSGFEKPTEQLPPDIVTICWH